MAIKLIASDMDGTLLSSDIAISEKNKNAIHKAVDNGIVFLIATGRMYVSAQPYAEGLGLDVPLVTYNGALVEGSLSHKVYYHNPFPWKRHWKRWPTARKRSTISRRTSMTNCM